MSLKRHRRAPRPRPTDEQFEAKHRSPCFLVGLTPSECLGPNQLAHWIPKQRLRAAGVPEDAIWDERVVSPICAHHHHLLDHRRIRLTREQLPDGLEDYAREHGLEGSLDRDYGPREELAA